MSTSRDIQKLFDHFGGNAGDYQEIGRENEAQSARTRWPLLATLDFAQPAIPDIRPRREAPPHSSEPSDTQPAGMPINRGKRQLFMRAHRRAIPPVTPPAAESLSALRFSATGESPSDETGTIPDSADATAASLAPVTNVAAALKPEPVRPAPAQVPKSVPNAPAPSAPQSILGKLFKPQAQEATNAPADSLNVLFERLRHAGRAVSEPTNTRAGRLPRL
ncbi:cellulose biosynthesis protein BcsP [Caballeronia sp. AZ10_KS36]|uniref:cellulose biosynthesis protein BcsP n=1 Tax=Caballeronia sp. AZ10_KS36 TaxID=2921757 RepID=UPI00202784DD|nr:cellulose biosynthesis protein BcsP [Caballeronia sp. AZ10_KS36]